VRFWISRMRNFCSEPAKISSRKSKRRTGRPPWLLLVDDEQNQDHGQVQNRSMEQAAG
jgi:hypothetical protein